MTVLRFIAIFARVIMAIIAGGALIWAYSRQWVEYIDGNMKWGGAWLWAHILLFCALMIIGIVVW